MRHSGLRQGLVPVDQQIFQQGFVHVPFKIHIQPPEAVVKPPFPLKGCREVRIRAQQQGTVLQQAVELVHKGGNGPGVKIPLPLHAEIHVEGHLVFPDCHLHALFQIKQSVAVAPHAHADIGRVLQQIVLPVQTAQEEGFPPGVAGGRLAAPNIPMVLPLKAP